MIGSLLLALSSPQVSETPDVCWADRTASLDEKIGSLNTTAFTVLIGGDPVYHFGDVARSEGLYSASVRKSLLALLYGPYVVDGTIDLDMTLNELGLDDVEGLTDDERTATIRHLLQSRSGVYHPVSNGGDSDEERPERGTYAPGEHFFYNNWDFNVAGHVFTQLTGENIYTAFDKKIGQRIGLLDYDPVRNQQRLVSEFEWRDASKYPPYFFTMSARDFARIGQLVNQRGKWDGEQVIPEEWVDEILVPHSGVMETSGARGPSAYGYMWWLFQPRRSVPVVARGAAIAWGHYGQFILSNAKLDVAAGHLTEPFSYDTQEEYSAGRTDIREFAGAVQLVWESYQQCGPRNIGWNGVAAKSAE